ncbi:hypothetical protein GWI33_005130 [Rhynchophorus ferrugineus]|uniref:Uncharacterized protein n=1 Tax=Rhynchophorus ferrugineus TaxID=354439 RepID=A0A834IWF2_RHYFE|nr:hypothetical protein GWI33_005130 [Rhynchophorus ferrugineus]
MVSSLSRYEIQATSQRSIPLTQRHLLSDDDRLCIDSGEEKKRRKMPSQKRRFYVTPYLIMRVSDATHHVFVSSLMPHSSESIRFHLESVLWIFFPS